MHTTLRSLAASLTVALLCTGGPTAESSPQALEWLKKLTQAYERSYRVGYRAEMRVAQMGQPITMTMEGVTTQADRRRMRMVLEITMSMGEMRTTIGMLGVLDGQTLWLESDDPLTGGKQVTRVPADQVGQLSMGGPGLAGGVSGIDPVGQIEQMAQVFDFDVAEISDGQVTLEATLTDEALAELSTMLPEAEGPKRFTIVLDERSGFPRSMRIGGATPFMVMTFEEVEFVDPAELDPELFRYTPAEGARMIDQGATISVDD